MEHATAKLLDPSIRRSGAALALLLLVGLCTPVPAQDSSPKDDLCPYLSPERRVSYKNQETDLFRNLLERVDDSSQDAPPLHEVVLAYAACLEKLRERGADLDGVRFEPSSNGSEFEVGLDPASPRKYRTRGKLSRLASRVTNDILRDVEPDRQEELANRLWFLWIESYLQATGEKYNSYDYADDLTEERARNRGRSFRVGFEVEFAETGATVSSIHDARLTEAGLATGDELLTLDGRTLDAFALPELQSYWFNPEPFLFAVTVRRSGETFEVAGESVVTRHLTTAWAVRGELGYVRIRNFSAGSLVEMRRAFRAMTTATVARLIVDLRDNPGGTVSTGLIDLFFKPGQTVLSYRDWGESESIDVDATVEYWGTPTAILVDRHSSSMAETLTAAFKIHERGPVVGEKTDGKGVGQTLYPVLDEGRVHLVQRTYYYPGTRETWNEIGIPPTVPVELDDEERERLQPYLDAHVVRLDEQWEVDPVLRAADRHLRGLP